MGTSLSGLTPATTFDGLLKVGDNDPLTADLKAISDGAGNDSAIQLSTGELKVIGQFNIDSDTAATTINLRGDGLSLNQIYQANNVTYNSIVLLNSSGIRLNNGTNTTLVARENNVGIGNGSGTPSARLHVKGSGNDNTTTSLLVENSDGDDLLKVTDDGNVALGTLTTFGRQILFKNNSGTLTYGEISLDSGTGEMLIGATRISYFPTFYSSGAEAMRIDTSQNVGIGETTPTARLHIKGEAPSGDPLNNPTALLVQNSNSATLLEALHNGNVGVGCPANAQYRVLMSSGVLRLKDLVFGQTDSAAINNTSGLTMKWNGSTGIGISGGGAIDATARLQVKGSGNDATTTALLVQNSDGDDMLKVTDDGKLSVLASVVGNLCATLENTSSTGFGLDIKAGVSSTNYSLQWRNYNGSGGGRMYPEGIIIGAQSTPSARLQVKGSGASSGTTALLVQNSEGENALQIKDNKESIFSGITTFDNNVNLNGANGTSSLNNLRFVVPGSAKSLTINKDYSFTNEASALVDIQSTTQGFLPPRMTEAQRLAINMVGDPAVSTPAIGLMVYQTDGDEAGEGPWVYTSFGWKKIQLM